MPLVFRGFYTRGTDAEILVSDEVDDFLLLRRRKQRVGKFIVHGRKFVYHPSSQYLQFIKKFVKRDKVNLFLHDFSPNFTRR
jgi:hypothetical protein